MGLQSWRAAGLALRGIGGTISCPLTYTIAMFAVFLKVGESFPGVDPGVETSPPLPDNADFGWKLGHSNGTGRHRLFPEFARLSHLAFSDMRHSGH
jgi:hypothetical protein